ncbi:MAG: RimK/LysX family protein [Pirellulales bacterium]
MLRLVRPRLSAASKWTLAVAALVVPLCLAVTFPMKGDVMPPTSKHVIGATATITELTTGLPFSARIDTGAASCSIHTIKWEIKDPAKRPADNVGKPIRLLIKNDQGDEKWIDTVIAGRVRIRNSALDDEDYHGRYKVKLPFEWNGFKKEVEVTINDRTEMEFPLLMGRNYLSGDFVVDVDAKGAASDK